MTSYIGASNVLVRGRHLRTDKDPRKLFTRKTPRVATVRSKFHPRGRHLRNREKPAKSRGSAREDLDFACINDRFPVFGIMAPIISSSATLQR